MVGKPMTAELRAQLADFFAGKPDILFSWLFGSYAAGKSNAYSRDDRDVPVRQEAHRV